MLTNKLIKNTLKLTLNYGAAQLILILTLPILTRLYSPNLFAIFGYITAFTSIILPVASLQYEYALPLIKSIKLLKTLLFLCAFLVIFTSSIALCFSLFFKAYLTSFAIKPELIFLCFIILILQGLIQVYGMGLLTQNKTSTLAYGKLIQNASMVFLQIFIAYYFYSTATTLLWGLIFGLSLNFIYFQIWISYKFKHVPSKMSKRNLLILLKHYRKLPLLSSWAAVIESTATLIPIFFIGPLYGAKNLGIYFLTLRVFNAPTGLLITALSKIILREASEQIKAKTKLMPFFKKISQILALIAICYLTFLYIIAHFTPLIFGTSWTESQSVLKILAPVIACTLCISPFSCLFLILKYNALDLLWQIIYLSTSILLIYACQHLPFLTMLTYLMILWLALYLSYWLLIYKIIDHRDKQLCVE